MHITPEIKTFLVALGFPELPDLQYDRYRGARRWSSLPYLYLNESKHVGWRPSRKDTPNVVVLQAYHHSAELKPFQANVTTPGVLKEAQAWIVKAKAEAEALWAANAKETERRDLAAARLSQDTARLHTLIGQPAEDRPDQYIPNRPSIVTNGSGDFAGISVKVHIVGTPEQVAEAFKVIEKLGTISRG